MTKSVTIKAIAAAALAGGVTGIANAGNLNIPNDFSAGNTASAADVNANFDAVETEVDDNHTRIQALEGQTTTRSMQFPAGSFSGSGSLISDANYGKLWDSGYASTLYVSTPAPPGYAGGDVTMTVMFHTEGGTDTGIVEFFTRARSASDGEDYGTTLGQSDGGVTVGGSSNLVYGQEITISGSQLDGDYWIITLQRGGGDATYSSPVVFHGIELEYEANL